MNSDDREKLYNEILELYSENEALVKKINVELTNKLKNKIERRDLALIDANSNLQENIEEEEELEDLVGDSASYYYDYIFKYTLSGNDEHDRDAIARLMPKKNCFNYEKIILRLIADFKLEILEYQKELYRLKDELTEEELEEYKRTYNSYILEYKKKIQFINEVYEIRKMNINELLEEREDGNKLVFMFKNADKSYGYKDLVSIPVDYYSKFLELLNSIKDGTFKNIKYLGKTNNKLSGIYEVKDFKIRILFDRLEPNVYCVLAFFMKKSDNDKDYREFCINRIATYRVKKDGIVACLKDADVCKLNEETLSSITELLSNDNLIGDEGVLPEYKGDVR